MSAPGAVPPPIPPEVLDEERERIRKQLELERGKSRVLYERAYQSYLQGVSGEKEQGPVAKAATEPQFLDKVRKAYEEAYALRAFRDVMEETTKPGQPAPQTMPSGDSLTTGLMRSGLPPQVVNQWLKSLDPEALGALVALSSNNPLLAATSFATSQRGQQLTIKDVIDLNAAIAKQQPQPNISIDIPKLVEAVKAQPPSASPTEIVNATISAIQTGMQMAGGGKHDAAPRSGGILETLLQTPEGAKTAKELGLIGGDTPMLTVMAEMRKNDQQFQERMRSSDRAWELRLEELKLRSNIERAKLVEGRRRTELIAGSLRRIGGAIAKGIGEGISEGEGKKAEGEEGETPQEYKCECGGVITVPPGTQPGAVVTCGKCGAQYDATPSEAKK